MVVDLNVKNKQTNKHPNKQTSKKTKTKQTQNPQIWEGNQGISLRYGVRKIITVICVKCTKRGFLDSNFLSS